MQLTENRFPPNSQLLKSSARQATLEREGILIGYNQSNLNKLVDWLLYVCVLY